MVSSKAFILLLFIGLAASAQEQRGVGRLFHEALPRLSEWSYRLSESMFRKLTPEERELYEIERRLMSNLMLPGAEKDIQRYAVLRPQAEAAREAQRSDLQRRNHICNPSTTRDLHNLFGGRCGADHGLSDLHSNIELDMEIRTVDLTVRGALEELKCEMKYIEDSFGRTSGAHKSFQDTLKEISKLSEAKKPNTRIPLEFPHLNDSVSGPPSKQGESELVSDSALAVIDLIQIQKRLNEIDRDLQAKGASGGFYAAKVGILPQHLGAVAKLREEKGALEKLGMAIYHSLWNIQNPKVRKIVDEHIHNPRNHRIQANSKEEREFLENLKGQMFTSSSEEVSESLGRLQTEIERRLNKGDYSDGLKREIVSGGIHKELADRLSSTAPNHLKENILTESESKRPGLVASGIYESDCRMQMRFGKGRDDLLFFTDTALLVGSAFYNPLFLAFTVRALNKCVKSSGAIQSFNGRYCDRYYSTNSEEVNALQPNRRNDAFWTDCSIGEIAGALGLPALRISKMVVRSPVARALISKAL